MTTNFVESFSQYVNRKVLLTGATGFIGAPLCRRLIEHGAEVYGISRSAQEPAASGMRWFQAEPADPCKIRQILSETKPDIIFHLAGMATAATELDLVVPTFDSLLASTVYLLSSAAELGCGRIVIPGSLTEPKEDDVDATPGSPYAAAKWASSAYSRMFFKLYGTPVVIARPFMTYGPGQPRSKLVPYVILAALRREAPKISSGQWQADWIYIDDVVEGFMAAGCTPGICGKTIDLGSGALTSVRAVVQKIIDLTDQEVHPIFGAQRDRRFEEVRVADTEFAYATLGWRSTIPLTEGLARTVDWLREHVNQNRTS